MMAAWFLEKEQALRTVYWIQDIQGILKTLKEVKVDIKSI